jgi:hypothetical protein
LETPSSRICLGMPMKMGTGCHDLIQKLEIWCSRNALRLQIFDINKFWQHIVQLLFTKIMIVLSRWKVTCLLICLPIKYYGLSYTMFIFRENFCGAYSCIILNPFKKYHSMFGQFLRDAWY